MLKARPEPPASERAAFGRQASLGPVEFQWSPNLEAKTARVQVAPRRTLLPTSSPNARGVEGNKLTSDLGGPGTYFWRLASTSVDGDKGPFGDAQRFELRPLPEPPGLGGLGEDGKSLLLAWGGRPEDMQHVELGARRAVQEIVAPGRPRTSRSGRCRRRTALPFRTAASNPDGSSALQLTAGHRGARDWRFPLAAGAISAGALRHRSGAADAPREGSCRVGRLAPASLRFCAGVAVRTSLLLTSFALRHRRRVSSRSAQYARADRHCVARRLPRRPHGAARACRAEPFVACAHWWHATAGFNKGPCAARAGEEPEQHRVRALPATTPSSYARRGCSNAASGAHVVSSAAGSRGSSKRR